MLVATALVLMMTPALGLFYAGLVRSKNTLNTFMMSIGAIAIALVTWAAVGYSLAFDGSGDVIGGLNYAFLHDVTFAPRAGATIPHLVFFAFQTTFRFNTGRNSVLAFTNTLLTPACTLTVWFVLDLIRGRKVTAIGAATAIVVGCVAITPAGGFVSPGWAMALGALGALPSYAIIVLRP